MEEPTLDNGAVEALPQGVLDTQPETVVQAVPDNVQQPIGAYSQAPVAPVLSALCKTVSASLRQINLQGEDIAFLLAERDRLEVERDGLEARVDALSDLVKSIIIPAPLQAGKIEVTDVRKARKTTFDVHNAALTIPYQETQVKQAAVVNT